MKLNHDPTLYPFVLPPNLVNLLNGFLKGKPDEHTCINFRDPDYSSDRGGYHLMYSYSLCKVDR